MSNLRGNVPISDIILKMQIPVKSRSHRNECNLRQLILGKMVKFYV